MKLKKDDNVIIVSGKDKGKTGKVIKAFPRENKIIVAGVNVIKTHKRATKQGSKGQIVDKTMPINASNAMIVDPKTQKASRIKIARDDKGRTRISIKSGTALS